jgi:S1-C subfamily serine protease
VPVLFFWTGYHPDYHMPSDTADKINVPGMRRVVDLAQDVIAELATVKERPKYVAVKIAGSGGSPTGGPRLGVMPAYTAGGEGMLLEEIVDGGPAARSGLKAGDRIVGIGERPVKNVQSYMQAMSAQKKGTSIDVHVLRDGKKQTIKVKLD